MCGTSAATLPTIGAWCGSQSSSWTFDRRRRRHVLDVDAFVDRDRAIARHAVGDEHRADRLGGADEAVDLAVLPARERMLPFRWKSTRRDTTSGGRGAAAVPIDSASAAIATPCGSCAWTTSGVELLDDARQPPRGRQVHFASRGASGIELEPFGGALAQLAVRVGDEHRPVAERPQPVHGQQHLVLAAAPGPRGVDVQREHQAEVRRSRRHRAVAACSSASFGELQEHVIRVQRRDDEAGARRRGCRREQVVAQERERRVAARASASDGAPAVRAHLPRRVASCSDRWSRDDR